jgi:hypothetical protein
MRPFLGRNGTWRKGRYITSAAPVSNGLKLPRYRRGLPSLSKDEISFSIWHELSGAYNSGIEIKDGWDNVKPL